MGEGKCYLGSLLIEELIAHDMCWAISLFEDVTSGRFFMFHAPMDGPTAMPIWIALTGLSRFIRDVGGMGLEWNRDRLRGYGGNWNGGNGDRFDHISLYNYTLKNKNN